MNLDIQTADVTGDVAMVVGVSSLLGAVARRGGQPTVVGQVLAGRTRIACPFVRPTVCQPPASQDRRPQVTAR